MTGNNIKENCECTRQNDVNGLRRNLDWQNAIINGLGVEMECIKSDMKAIAEGHGFLDDKIENIRKDILDRLQMLNTRFDMITGELQSFRRDVNTLKRQRILARK